MCSSSGFDLACTMLNSLVKNNDSANINLFVFSNELDSTSISFLEKEFGFHSCKLIEMDDNLVSGIEETHHYGIYAYFRLFVYQYVAGLDRILLLDTDMIIRGDLKPLYNMGFDGKSVIACLDTMKTVGKGIHPELIKQFQLEDNDDYFNTGMLLMNIPRMMKLDYASKMFEVCKRYKEYIKYADQDIFNIFYANDKKIVSNEYNFIINNYFRSLFEIDNPTILHFTGSVKPNNYKFSQKYFTEFWKYNNTTVLDRLLFMIKHYLFISIRSLKRMIVR